MLRLSAGREIMEGKFLAQVKTAHKIMLMIPVWNGDSRGA